ncbi:hypothetical protein, partial [Gluconobacter albidus]|uniref:hypothetical protein n=1 Tax=Gluconobacter albidus TaxID=318683 RepID=UPI001E528A00
MTKFVKRNQIGELSNEHYILRWNSFLDSGTLSRPVRKILEIVEVTEGFGSVDKRSSQCLTENELSD